MSGQQILVASAHNSRSAFYGIQAINTTSANVQLIQGRRASSLIY